MTSDMRLPILDLSRLNGDEAECGLFREELRRATHEYGFFYLTGHGIPDEVLSRIIAVGREFFALPEADKLAIENVNSRHFRGYTRVGAEQTLGVTDWREQIDVGPERDAVEQAPGVPDFWTLEGPNLWPDQLPALRETVIDWQNRLSELSLTLMRAWAQSLGADADVFDDAFAHNPSTLTKIVRYPGSPEPAQGVGAHKDYGVLTLLYVEEGKAGLQVEKDGEWIDAPPIPGAFVVNIGELLEVATGGYLKATIHRVLSPRGEDDRISVPFFYGPALDRAIPTLELPPELAAEASGVTADAAGQPLFTTYGENALKSRLRAHPNVAERHHPSLV